MRELGGTIKPLARDPQDGGRRLIARVEGAIPRYMMLGDQFNAEYSSEDLFEHFIHGEVRQSGACPVTVIITERGETEGE